MSVLLVFIGDTGTKAVNSVSSTMDTLYTRGVRHFKFVDRTFNLSAKVSGAILDFFLERMVPGLFLHFEMIPTNPPALERIKAFPPGSRSLRSVYKLGTMRLPPGLIGD